MSTLVENVICKFCGCLCDDIAVEVKDNRILKTKRACPNGKGIFLDYDPGFLSPMVDGKEVTLDEAISASAKILNAADSPLIYGLSSTCNEAVERAVELADLTGAAIDTTASVCHFPTALAFQRAGEATCTLGEVKNRADLLIFWGCNPMVSHIRHFSRYSASAKGKLTPGGRKDRTLVVVDVRPTATSKMADLFLQVDYGTDFEVITTLRAMVQGRQVTPGAGGLPPETLEKLAGLMKNCNYGVVFFGMGLTMTPGRSYNLSELFSLVNELNEFTRFSAMPMRGHGNVAGADQVVTWKTGYPSAVSLARGYPQIGPGEFTSVDMLARKEADAALVVASDPMAHFPKGAADHLTWIPTILMAPQANSTARAAKVFFPTACYGIDMPGTATRMDGVPLRYRAALTSEKPSDEEIFFRIIKEINR